MSDVEAAKLQALVAQLDRLCADAQQIRLRINEITGQRPSWPDLRQRPRPVAESDMANDFATLPDGERNN